MTASKTFGLKRNATQNGNIFVNHRTRLRLSKRKQSILFFKMNCSSRQLCTDKVIFLASRHSCGDSCSDLWNNYFYKDLISKHNYTRIINYKSEMADWSWLNQASAHFKIDNKSMGNAFLRRHSLPSPASVPSIWILQAWLPHPLMIIWLLNQLPHH